MLLAGDIGGTKTVLAIFSAENLHQPLRHTRYESERFDGFEPIIERFLADGDELVEAAAFGVAGPVVRGRSKITNLSWAITEEAIAEQLGSVPVRLLNDLAAIANAIPLLEADDLHVLASGEAEQQAPIAVIAPGTGLGMAYMTWDGNFYRTHPSEGGHVSFSPTDATQLALLNFLLDKYDHVSTERVCSGRLGIPNIYDFLKETGRAQEPAWLGARLQASPDPTPIIVDNAFSDTACAICRQTLDIFVAILADEAGDAALTFLATGGVYLGGGIPPRILPALQSPNFRRVFCNKGRFTNLMTRIPLKVILNPQAALLGAARAGMELL